MKINKLVIVFGLIFSILLSTVVYASVSDVISEEDLSAKSFDEILNDMNSDNINMELNYSEALREKMKTVSGDRIVEEILNENNKLDLRILILNACFAYDDEIIDIDYDKLKHVLFDDEQPTRLKIFILMGIYVCDDDVETLVQVAKGNDEQLAFHAIKYLMALDFPKAVEIADEIIENFSGPAGYKARAAIIVRAEELTKSSTQEEITEFISFCNNLLYDEYEEDPIIIDGVAFELMDIHNKECIDYILHCDKMDLSLKRYGIHKNYDIVGYIFGDTNSDNKVNASDALNVLKYSAKINEMDSYQILVSELNWDDTVNASDALLILQYSAKIIEEFPIMSKDYVFGQPQD